jgi:hypothetical protein
MRRLTRDQAREIRELYENSPLSLKMIAAQTGVSTATIQNHSRHQGWRPRRGIKAPESERPRRWLGKPCTGLAECPERAALVARAWAAAHVQINEIEKRMMAVGDAAGRMAAASDDAKAVATLVRTLKDLTALDRVEAGGGKKALEGTPDGQATGARIDELADELARRLAGLRKRGPFTGASGGA